MRRRSISCGLGDSRSFDRRRIQSQTVGLDRLGANFLCDDQEVPGLAEGLTQQINIHGRAVGFQFPRGEHQRTLQNEFCGVG